MSVICGSPTGSYVIDMKNLVATKLYSFDETSVYLKAVGFLLITFLERKIFLKIVYTCDRLCPVNVLFINCRLSSQSSQSFAQSY